MITVKRTPDPRDAIKVVDELISTFHLIRRVDIDIDYNVVIWFDKFEFITKRSLVKNCDGRGETYAEACVKLVDAIHKTKYNIRVNGGYHTKDVIEIVDKIYENKE